MNITIASRDSQLALWQSNFIKNKLISKGHTVDIITIKTKGDIILDTPLAKIGGKGLFTKELENSILNSQADIAVHSLKDVPTTFPNGLKLACVCTREDPRDAMLSMKYKSLSELPKNAKVGTTSLRRKMQILALRGDLNVVSLRGNVNSRIEKLKNSQFDAIVLAMAGIKRLNLLSLVKFVFALDTIPAMGQGALGIESIDKEEILEAVEFLNDENAFVETTIERDFVHTLNGGCQAPIGIKATLSGDKIYVNAILGLSDGSEILKDSKIYPKLAYKVIGKNFANEFIDRGAKDLLKRAEMALEDSF